MGFENVLHEAKKTAEQIHRKKIKIIFIVFITHLWIKNGGEGEIRTLETLAHPHAFQACAFDHSATSPKLLCNFGEVSPAKNILFLAKRTLQLH